jgi:hypothetical protein
MPVSGIAAIYFKKMISFLIEDDESTSGKKIYICTFLLVYIVLVALSVCPVAHSEHSRQW